MEVVIVCCTDGTRGRVGGAGGVGSSDVDMMLLLPVLVGLAVCLDDPELCADDDTVAVVVAVVATVVATVVVAAVFFVVITAAGTATAGSDGGRIVTGRDERGLERREDGEDDTPATSWCTLSTSMIPPWSLLLLLPDASLVP